MTNEKRDEHILNISKSMSALLEMAETGKKEREALFLTLEGNGQPGIKRKLATVEVRFSEHLKAHAKEDKRVSQRANAVIAKAAIACALLSTAATIAVQLLFSCG